MTRQGSRACFRHPSGTSEITKGASPTYSIGLGLCGSDGAWSPVGMQIERPRRRIKLRRQCALGPRDGPA
jgi:hypothetical protein